MPSTVVRDENIKAMPRQKNDEKIMCRCRLRQWIFEVRSHKIWLRLHIQFCSKLLKWCVRMCCVFVRLSMILIFCWWSRTCKAMTLKCRAKPNVERQPPRTHLMAWWIWTQSNDLVRLTKKKEKKIILNYIFSTVHTVEGTRPREKTTNKKRTLKAKHGHKLSQAFSECM